MKRTVYSLVFLAMALANAAVLRVVPEGEFAARLLEISALQVRVELPWSPDAATLSLASLDEWTGTATATVTQTPDIRLFLTSGDEISGKLLAVEAEWIRMTTAWGQNVGVRRTMVKRMELLPMEGLLVDRPAPLQHWTLALGRGQGIQLREIGGDVQPSRGPSLFLSRELPPLPDRFRMDLRLRLLEGTPVFLLQFSTNAASRYGAASFTVNVNKDKVAVIPLPQNMGPPTTAPLSVPSSRKGVFLFQIYGDWESRNFQVWLNETRLWSGKVPLPEQGSLSRWATLQLRSLAEMAFVIEEFRIRTWDSPPMQEDVFQSPPTGLRMLFRNGDSLPGSGLTFADGGFTLDREAAVSLQIPLRSLDQILFAEKGSRQPRRQARDVRVLLGASRDRLTFALSSLQDELLSGNSEAWEEPLRIPLAYVSHLRFNIYGENSSESAWYPGERR